MKKVTNITTVFRCLKPYRNWYNIMSQDGFYDINVIIVGKLVKSATISGFTSMVLILSLSLAVTVSLRLSINKVFGLCLSNQNIRLPQQASNMIFVSLITLFVFRKSLIILQELARFYSNWFVHIYLRYRKFLIPLHSLHRKRLGYFRNRASPHESHPV